MKRIYIIDIICILTAMPISTYARIDQQLSLARAHKHYQKKEYARAHDLYQKIVIDNPTDPQALNGLANTLYAQKNFSAAQNYYQELTTHTLIKSSEREHAWFNLGCTYAQQKAYQEALDAFTNAQKLDPSNERTKKNIDILKKLLEQKNKSPNNDAQKPQNRQGNQPDEHQPKDKGSNGNHDEQKGQPDKNEDKTKQQGGQQERPGNQPNTNEHAANDKEQRNTDKQPQQHPHERHEPSPQNSTNQQNQSTKKAPDEQLTPQMNAVLKQISDIEHEGQQLYIQALAGQQKENPIQPGW